MNQTPAQPPAHKEEPEQSSEDSIPQDENTDNSWQTEPLREPGKTEESKDGKTR